MWIDEIQAYEASLIDAYAAFNKKVSTILDDGTYPKLPQLEETLSISGCGLAIIAWRIGAMGLVDRAQDGSANELLHLPIVIQENVKVNRGASGTGVPAQRAVDYVQMALAGNPKGRPPFTPILVAHDPFLDMGVVGGVWTIIVNFTKQHRVSP